jgi:hypothetical protein
MGFLSLHDVGSILSSGRNTNTIKKRQLTVPSLQTDEDV